MKDIELSVKSCLDFISQDSINAYESKVKECAATLENGTGRGSDFLGWLHLPSSITPEFLADIKATAKQLRENCEVVVVAGIGGSYLGAKAVIEALSNSFSWLKKPAPAVVYAGNNIGEDYLAELCEYLSDKKFGIINISKSGTTTETALAFRLLKTQLETHSSHNRQGKRSVAQPFNQGRVQDIRHSRQCGRTFFSAHPRRFATHCRSWLRCGCVGCRSSTYGGGLRLGYPVCRKPRRSLCRYT